MEKQSKQSATKTSNFPVYYKITAISAVLVSLYAMFLMAVETYAAK